MVVGFSGGPDSLALAAVLARVAHVEPVPITLVHVDHNLRPESAIDADACGSLADALNLSCVVVKLPEGVQRRHAGVGVEEAARRERYVALAETAGAVGTSVVAVAHHVEDQAETVLLHLTRGAGLTGASAMAEVSQRTIPWWLPEERLRERTIDLWRPFLEEERETVRAYALATGLTPVADTSNDDPVFRRNRVRNEVMPILGEIFPEAAMALARYARIAGDEDRLLALLADEILPRMLFEDGRLSLNALFQEHPAIQRRVLRTWLRRHSATAEISLDRVDSLLTAAIDKRSKRTIEIGGGLVAVVDHDTIDIRRMIEHESGSDWR